MNKRRNRFLQLLNAWVLVLIPGALISFCVGQEERLSSLSTVELTADEELIAKVRKAMLSFAESREELPSKFAFFVRGQRWVYGEADGMFQVEHFYLGARDETSLGSQPKDRAHLYFAYGTRTVLHASPDGNVRSDMGLFWEQFVRVSGATYYRVGNDGQRDSIKEYETNEEVKTSVGKSPAANIDFYSLPIGYYRQLLRADLPRSFVTNYLRGEVVSAGKQGEKLVGAWRFRLPDGKLGAMSIVTFDGEQGMRPVKVEWLKRNDGQESEAMLAARDVRSTVETRWKPMKIGKDEEYWLPESIKGAEINKSKRASSRGRRGVFFLHWRFGGETMEAMPRVPLSTDENWRSPFLTLFGQDLAIPYEEYLESRAINQKADSR